MVNSTQILLTSFIFWLCFITSRGMGPDPAFKSQPSFLHEDREKDLIQTKNEKLEMDNSDIKSGQNRGKNAERLEMDKIFGQFDQHISARQKRSALLRTPRKLRISRSVPNQFQIHVKLDKNLLTLWMNSDRTVKSVIVEIQEKNQGPPIYDHRLMYKEKQLDDSQTMAECGIIGDEIVTPVLHLLRYWGFADYYRNPEYFDPQFDRDFRDEKDDGTKYYHSAHVYHPPYGSLRYAIKVLHKYGNNVWFGKSDILPMKDKKANKQSPKSTDHPEIKPADDKATNNNKIITPRIYKDNMEKEKRLSPSKQFLFQHMTSAWMICGLKSTGKWPVAYHGTREGNVIGILKDGFRLDNSKFHFFGRGIYVTPYPEVALFYAKEYEFNDRKYKLIIQSRVDPSKLKVKRTGYSETYHEKYWILPDGDAIRPYGICVYEVKN